MNGSERIRRALDSEPVPRDLEARVRAGLDARAPSQWGRLISSVALLVILLGGTQFYASTKTRQLLRTGVEDHIHCAIAGVYPHQTDRAQMIEGLGPWAPVLQPVLDQAPGASVVSAHRCTIEGRNYVHIILRNSGNKAGGTMISVIATRRGSGETFPRELAAHIVHASGVSIHLGNLEGYSVASFDAGAWLGYVVSGLPQTDNERLAERIAPVIVRYTGT